MRKVLFVVTLLVLFVSSFAWAEDTGKSEEVLSEKLTTTFTFKNDTYIPSAGESFNIQRVSIYSHWRNFGLGSDFNIAGKTDYFQAKPFATVNSGPWYLVAGGAFSNMDSFVQAGFWYVNKHAGFDIFVDVRNYFGLDGRSKGFLDSFIEVTRPIGESKKFFIGINAENNHWWGGGHEWYQAGPVAGYKFGKVLALKDLTVFGRIAREWDDCYGCNTQADSFRVGFTVQF